MKNYRVIKTIGYSPENYVNREIIVNAESPEEAVRTAKDALDTEPYEDVACVTYEVVKND